MRSIAYLAPVSSYLRGAGGFVSFDLEELRLKSSNDEARIKELEAQVANLKPAHGFKIDIIKVLKVFFEAGRELTARQIESHLQM